MANDIPDEKAKGDAFTDKIKTRIWQEDPETHNPFICKHAYCHGYEHTELVTQCSYIENIYLLFKSELPNKKQLILFEQLLNVLINPGPRHSATRAAMNAGIGKTQTGHILPIALNTLSGEHLGSKAVEEAMKYLLKHIAEPPQQLVNELLLEGSGIVLPGFGQRFGDIDCYAEKMLSLLFGGRKDSNYYHWAMSMQQQLKAHGQGLLMSGVAAVAFSALDFSPREGAGLYQFAAAPGLLAHGLEMAGQPITAMPFIPDKNYRINYDK